MELYKMQAFEIDFFLPIIVPTGILCLHVLMILNYWMVLYFYFG